MVLKFKLLIREKGAFTGASVKRNIGGALGSSKPVLLVILSLSFFFFASADTGDTPSYTMIV